MVCMASFLSSIGRTSSNFDNIHLILSTHVYFMMLFHSMQLRYKIVEIYFMKSSPMKFIANKS